MSSFHSTTVVFSVWFFNHSDHHSYCRYCHIVKNKCWLYLISEYAKHFFCLIGKTLCPAKAIIRGVFRTLSTMMELLVKISYGFYLYYSFLTGSWIHPWSWYSIFFFWPNFPSESSFSWELLQKGRHELWLHIWLISITKSRKRYTNYCCTAHFRNRVFKVG